MRLIRRCAFGGTIILILLLGIVLFINFNDKYEELTTINNTLSTTINNQTSTIQELEAKINGLNTQLSQLKAEKTKLEEKNIQLETDKNQLINEMNDLLIKVETSTKTLGGSFKSYTDYNLLSRSSPQWKLQTQAYTDENGLRKIGDAYLVALGSYYGTTLGTYYVVTLSNGNSFEIILCDMKNDMHTDANNQICLSNGSIIEFYVDSSKLPSYVKSSGSIGSIDFFSGDVVNIVPMQ